MPLQLNSQPRLRIPRTKAENLDQVSIQKVTDMWGMDPEIWKQFETMREMVKLSQQTPTKEWPLVFVEEFGTLLVIREWPGGNMTAYTATKDSSDKS